jgi:hypothetical protein
MLILPFADLPFQAGDLTLMFFRGLEGPAQPALPVCQGFARVVEPAAQLLDLTEPVGSGIRLWGSGPHDLSAWCGQHQPPASMI